MTETDTTALERVEGAIKNIKENNFTLYFFVADSKGTPNGSLAYIYTIAKTLQDLGYNIKMLYQLENEYTANELYQLKKKDKPIDYRRVFQGVEEWMGKMYSELPHMNVAVEEWKVGPSDFLFIPEAFASLMYETYKYNAPCKRIVILQNYDYIMDFLPYGTGWKDYGIHEVIATSETQASLASSVFPYINTHILRPSIPDYFRKPLVSQNLVVNIIAKNTEDVNKVIKPFYWKYPVLKYISFRDLRNYPREEYAKLLQESAITVWIDDETPFGYSALEAMRCGNVVIGKIPDTMPEWMCDKDGNIVNNGFWTYDAKTIPDTLAKVVVAWMQDELPVEMYECIDETNKKYTESEFVKNTKELFTEIINKHIETLEEVRRAINNTNKTQEQ